MRIETPRLVLRDWEPRDAKLFHRINSDETVMRFYPFRRTRAEADIFMEQLSAQNLKRGYGFAAVELKETGHSIGMAGLKPTLDVPARQPEATEIGWRLIPESWHKGYATEAARAWIDFGFGTLGLEEVVSFAVEANEASIAVMRRLGMSVISGGQFHHPSVPDSYPDLKRHILYAMSRRDWRGHGTDI